MIQQKCDPPHNMTSYSLISTSNQFKCSLIYLSHDTSDAKPSLVLHPYLDSRNPFSCYLHHIKSYHILNQHYAFIWSPISTSSISKSYSKYYSPQSQDLAHLHLTLWYFIIYDLAIITRPFHLYMTMSSFLLMYLGFYFFRNTITVDNFLLHSSNLINISA